MPQARDEAGNIWETDAQGNPVRLVSKGQAQPQPSVTELPETGRERDERERKNREEGRDDTRTNIAVSGEQRQEAKTSLDSERDLRTEFNGLPAVKDYQTVIRQYATALRTKASPSGDQALITAYAKMLDPGSVVREQEFNTVANADSAVGQVKSQLARQFGWDGGGMMRPEIREKVRNEMLNLTLRYRDAYNYERARYSKVAQDHGVNPGNVIGEHFGQQFLPILQQYEDSQKKQPSGKTIGDLVPAEAADVGLTGTVSDDQPPRPGETGYRGSYLGQTVSGVNEGIGNMLGAPVDLTTMAMNLVPRGINALANTNIGSITNPALGSDWWKRQMNDWAIYGQSDDPRKQFARRVGESVGSSMFPVMAAETVPARIGTFLSAAGGGAGAAAAQQAFPGNPLAEMAGEVAGSGLTGMGLIAGARRSAQREIEKAVPTIGDLKEQAGNLYRRAEARIGAADPALTQKLASDFRQALMDDSRMSPTGRMSEVYPKAKEAMHLIDDYAGQPMTPGQMQTVRRVVAEGMNSPDASDRRLSSILTNVFDDWADPLAPELKDARKVSSRYLNAEKIQRARELAGARAGQFSGSGYENALRTEFRKLDRNSILGKGRYGKDVTGAIENVSRGTTGSNLAREIGKRAPSGNLSTAVSAFTGGTVGGYLGGPLGAAVGAVGLPTIGQIGRSAATHMTDRNVDLAELVARNGGALPEVELLNPEIKKQIAALLASQSTNYLPSD